jgi:ABC-2 type transport system permease protein
MTSTHPSPELAPIGATRRSQDALSQLRNIWSHRALMMRLAGREVKSRHKSSVLGFSWNLVNPLLQMCIYTLVFTYFMPGRTPMFPLKLLTGTAIFALFNQGVMGGTLSIVSNSALVSKIWFPREILPVASVLANIVTFVSRVSILLVASLLYWHPPAWSMLWLTVVATLVTMILAIGLAILLSGINVFFRDVQHFLDLAMLALFWFTPVIWNYSFLANEISNRLGPQWERLAMLNPMTPIVTTFQRVIYNPAALPVEQQGQFDPLLRPTTWYLQNLSFSLLCGLVALYAGLRIFARLEGSFVEHL